jgi:hypothetical protein
MQNVSRQQRLEEEEQKFYPDIHKSMKAINPKPVQTSIV